MATWDDVHELAMALPGARETTKWGNRTWAVERGFVWVRPLRRRDVEAVGAQDGPVMAACVADEHEKQALLAEDTDVFFTVPHFDGHPVVLVRLDRISRARLAELVVSAWAEVAPRDAVASYLAGRPPTLE